MIFLRIKNLTAVLFIVLVSPVVAQEYVEIPRDRRLPLSIVEENDVNFIPAIGRAMAKLGAALDSGDNLAVSGRLEVIKEWKNRLGSKNVFFVSRFLMVTADRLARAGHLERSVQTARDAEALSPDDYRTKLGLARLTFAADRSNVKGYVLPLLYAVAVYFKDPVNRLAALTAVLKLMFPAIILAFTIHVFVGLAVYGKLVVKDIARALSFDSSAKPALLVPLLVLASVILAGGIMAAVLAALFFSLAYQKSRERMVTFFFLIFLALLPLLTEFAARSDAMEESPLYRAVTYYAAGNWEPVSYKMLTAAVESEPDNTELLLALASMNRRLGNFVKAEHYLETLIEKKPDHAKGLNELGNLRFQQKEYRLAELMYKKAIKTSPKTAELHYNLSKAYLEEFRTEDANQEFGISMQMDKKKTEGLVKREGEKGVAGIASLAADLSELPLLESEIKNAAGMKTSALRAAFVGKFPVTYYYAGAAVYMILLLVTSAVLRKLETSTSCSSCGDTFVPTITAPGQEEYRCNQCVVLSSSMQKVLKSKKDKKLVQIRDYQFDVRRRSNILNLILPGLGSLYIGQYAGGAVILCLSSVFIVKLFYILSPLLAGYTGAIFIGTGIYAVWGMALAVFYVVGGFALRREL
ncbi:MAG: hypothetical protein IEMM0002_1169 [bacterium]|nr:MAG: hypothetical protein IEMM0002_1169 [bacterium]